MEYTRKQLDEAFTKVCNPNDWRAPIRAIIPRSILNVTTEAIMYFTGTEVNIKPVDKNRVEVYSVGYRNGPCGP